MSDQWNEKAREIWKDIERQQVFEDLSQCALKLSKEHAIADALRAAFATLPAERDEARANIARLMGELAEERRACSEERAHSAIL